MRAGLLMIVVHDLADGERRGADRVRLDDVQVIAQPLQRREVVLTGDARDRRDQKNPMFAPI